MRRGLTNFRASVKEWERYLGQWPTLAWVLMFLALGVGWTVLVPAWVLVPLFGPGWGWFIWAVLYVALAWLSHGPDIARWLRDLWSTASLLWWKFRGGF